MFYPHLEDHTRWTCDSSSLLIICYTDPQLLDHARSKGNCSWVSINTLDPKLRSTFDLPILSTSWWTVGQLIYNHLIWVSQQSTDCWSSVNRVSAKYRLGCQSTHGLRVLIKNINQHWTADALNSVHMIWLNIMWVFILWRYVKLYFKL